MTRRWKMLIAGAALSGTAACTVGPRDLNAHADLPPATAARPETIAPAAGPAQAVVDTTAPSEWWHAFNSTRLDTLVSAALAHNNDLTVAEATLRQAREQAFATGASAFPQADASYQAERVRVSDALSPNIANQNQQLYTLHTAQVTVNYDADLFGGVRQRIRSARAAAEVQRHRLDAARTSVVGNLVQAVITRASLAAQIEAARTSIAVNRDILSRIQLQQRLGAVGLADVATQQTALATAESALPPLERAEAHQQVLIATLIGVAAGNPLPALPTLDDLALPARLPLTLPSDLVARRPDVRAAQAQLVGAGADVGAAIAARLPSITLSANAGGVAQRFGDMFRSGNPFWALLGGITQPIFHAGQLKHQQRAAEAALDGAKAQYRGTVLQAFADVSDALTALRTDAEQLDAATRSTQAAGQALTFVRRQLALGSVGTLALLNATAADAQARQQVIQARAGRLSDTVALFTASGGVIAAPPAN
ncbi:efflux transporter outer membrane subunit [Sphingomonas sp.]|jgi:NodT family efflux transporter outer membrane factor (OMF) lipoprotein|uniref:efflux transporter outer membrane subunit n=1 Tax=Sphingomonas sp. TaxID=28214 RepID=UPI0035C7A1FE